MKRFFLFQKTTGPDWSLGKKAGFWLWNLFFVAASALGIGALSLFFAAVVQRGAMFKSYFTHPLIALLNLAPVLLLMLVLYFLTGRAGLSYGVTAGVTLGLTIASWFKLQFRNDPMMFEDLFLIKEAGNMAGKYQLFVTKTMVAALLLVLAGWAFLHFFVRGRLTVRPRYLGFSLCLCLCFPLSDAVKSDDVYNNRTANNDLINRWSATEVYTSKGFVYPFLHSSKSAFEAPPDGYDEHRAKAILSAYADADIPEDQKVNVISIMLESYNDFTKFGVPALDPKVYADYHALEAEGVSGNLVTNIFAGGTVDSERMFLTGYSDLGSFRAQTNAYPWYFRSQGYYATGAHGCYSWFYNRENINPNMGFQDYKFVENYFADATGGDVAYDKTFFPGIIDQWENRPKDQPFFAYDLTYQGHGPYNDDVLWWEDGYNYVLGGDYTDAERNILNNYFGSVYDTNQHLKEFFDYYRKAPEPVVIVVFGDHNPWLGDGNSVYHALGIDLDFSTEAGFYNYYATRYLIWANDAAKAALGRDFTGEGPTISPNFLMNEVFRQCGWTGPAFTQATQQVMDRVPVINNPTGLYVENGALTGALTPEGQALEDDYEMLQYYYRKHFLY